MPDFLGVAHPAGAMTAKFELSRDFCMMLLHPKFHHPVFTRLEVIMLTNKHTHKQTDFGSNIQRSSLCYDVGNKISNRKPTSLTKALQPH